MAIEFRACCCLKPRTGALLAGSIDILLGLCGILAIILLHLGYFDTMATDTDSGEGSSSSQNTNENSTIITTTPTPSGNSTNSEDEDTKHRWNGVVCLYAFAAIAAIFHGILLITAAGKKESFYNGAALIVNVLMILGCLGGTVALFILGYHWFNLALMPFFIIIQAYFLWVGHDYQKYFSYSQPINVKPRA